MSLNEDDVAKIAHLARLNIANDDMAKYAKELSKMLDMVEQINQANTDDITPMAHPLENMVQRFRADSVTEKVEREQYQAIAPNHEAGLYLVPQVIGEE